ncbi:MAG: hypothetical protein LE178_05930 [Endomicrobium sp.]|nr:hypothetical protein [Endomicrobium sp.]
MRYRVYEQCGSKEGSIFVRSKSLAGIEMDKSGIQEYEGIAEDVRNEGERCKSWIRYTQNSTKQSL